MSKQDEILTVVDAAILLQRCQQRTPLTNEQLFGPNNHPNREEMEATRQLVRPALAANALARLLAGELEGGNLRQRHPLTGSYMPRYDGSGRDALVSLREARAALSSDRHGILFVTEAPDTMPTPATDQAQQTETTDEQTTNAEAFAATDPDAELAELFDSVRYAQLEKMFPDRGKWEGYAEHAARNGLKAAAKTGRGLFNPYRAGKWWLSKGPAEWDWARCLRTLANNLPARSRDSKHRLTGDFND